MKYFVLLAIALAVPAGVYADADRPADAELYAAPVALSQLLERVEATTDRTFLVAPQVPKHLYAGHFDIEQLDYPLLLSILRNNDLAAVTVQGVTNVVREATVRQYALPIVGDDDADFADDEWVTRLVYLQHMRAPASVPVLRPMLPVVGHLAAVSDLNAVLIVDRYANVRRVEELLKDLDSKAGERQVAHGD